MKLTSNMYISIEDCKLILDNLGNRIAEIKDEETRKREYKLMHKKIRAIANQEERVVDIINKENGIY